MTSNGGKRLFSEWPGSYLPEPKKLALRDRLVAEVYTPAGVTLWLRHAEKEGWSLDEQIGRLWQAVDGVFV